jgi:flagellar biosynthesis protein FlhA
MSANTLARPRPVGLARLLEHSDVILAFAVVAIAGMMIVPVPAYMIDFLLVLNVSITVGILLITMYVKEPLEFSVFPSLLLITTLFRLSLNISASRLILLQASAGKIIDAFGQLMVGGNYAVGIVVFLILMVIQFSVITNGSGRVAEVAARFTLDAMPGKQMSIDADMNAGIITEDEARARRRVIEQEADFYGAMDGASKFVKGDAIAAVVIVIVNIVGGFFIGLFQHGMSLTQALQTYTLLTVGEGLVSQIPALFISTATGIIVTRAGTDRPMGEDLINQTLGNYRVLGIVAGMLLAIAIVPGFPKPPFIILGGIAGTLAFVMRRGALASETKAEPARPRAETTEDVTSLLQVDALELEIGYSLIPLADASRGGNLLDRIASLRRQIATDLGIILPKVRIRDNLRLEPQAYVIKLRGEEIARGDLRPHGYLAMNPGQARGDLEGIATTEPAFGLPAKWITAAVKEQAEIQGYTVVDPPSVLITHLSETLKSYAPSLLNRQDVQNLLNNVKKEYPAVLEGLVPDPLGVSEIQRILQGLLKERVPIRDLVTILEALAHKARDTKDADVLTELARQAMARTITNQNKGNDGALHVFTLSPRLERELNQGVTTSDQGLRLNLDPGRAERILRQVGTEMEKMAQAGNSPVALSSGAIRLPFKRLTEIVFPTLTVMAYSEVTSQTPVYSSGVVDVSDAG